MHLISHGLKLGFKSSYSNESHFARAYSLPYVFCKLRIHRNLTKAALGKKFLVSERYVADVEHGRRFPTLKYCLACGDLFGFNPNWIKVKWSDALIQQFSVLVKERLGLDD